MANLFDNVREGQPKSFVTGDYVAWTRSDLSRDYPTDLYSASLLARGLSDNVNEFTINANKVDGVFVFEATNAVTSQVLPSEYGWQIEITRDSDGARLVVDRGTISVKADYDAAGIDLRSHSEILLAKIESLLEGKADADVMEYEIGGRSLKKIPYSELVKMRDYYRGEVLKERQKTEIEAGRKGPSTIMVRF